MANLVRANVKSDQEQMGFWRFFYGGNTWSAGYIHIKTDIPWNSEVMIGIEAVGHNFGAYQAIRCQWSWYAYNQSPSAPYSVGLQNGYSGLLANGIYYSSDGYAVLRGYHSASIYYFGFTLNAHMGASGGGSRKINVLAYTVTTSSANQY